MGNGSVGAVSEVLVLVLVLDRVVRGLAPLALCGAAAAAEGLSDVRRPPTVESPYTHSILFLVHREQGVSKLHLVLAALQARQERCRWRLRVPQ